MRPNPMHYLTPTQLRLLAHDMGVSEAELLRSMNRLALRGAPKRTAAPKKRSAKAKRAVANPDRSLDALHRTIDRAIRKAEKSKNLRDINAIRAELISDVGGASSRAGQIAAAHFDTMFRAPAPKRRTNAPKTGARASHRSHTPHSLDTPTVVSKAFIPACTAGSKDDSEALLRLVATTARKLASTDDGRELRQSFVVMLLEQMISAFNRCARHSYTYGLPYETLQYIHATFIPDMVPSEPKPRGRVRLIR